MTFSWRIWPRNKIDVKTNQIHFRKEFQIVPMNNQKRSRV